MSLINADRVLPFVSHPDQKAGLLRLAGELDATVAALEALGVGDPAAADLVRQGFEQMMKLNQIYSVFELNLLPAHVALSRESARILGIPRPPNWSKA